LVIPLASGFPADIFTGAFQHFFEEARSKISGVWNWGVGLVENCTVAGDLPCKVACVEWLWLLPPHCEVWLITEALG